MRMMVDGRREDRGREGWGGGGAGRTEEVKGQTCGDPVTMLNRCSNKKQDKDDRPIMPTTTMMMAGVR